MEGALTRHKIVRPVFGITDLTAPNAHTPPDSQGRWTCLEQLAFALVAVALAAPFLVPVLLSQLGQSSQDTAAVAQDERPIRLVGRKIATVGAILFARLSLSPNRGRTAILAATAQ